MKHELNERFSSRFVESKLSSTELRVYRVIDNLWHRYRGCNVHINRELLYERMYTVVEYYYKCVIGMLTELRLW